MATEVLHPHDPLGERLRIPHARFHRRRNIPGNLNVNRRQSANASHRKTPSNPEKKRRNAGEESGGPKRELQGPKDDGDASGQLVLLRRGESLDSLTAKIKSGSPKLKSPERKPVDELPVLVSKGPEVAVLKSICSSPERKPADKLTVLGKKISGTASLKPIGSSQPPRPDDYAGSAFSLSPPPQSLPFPSFFNKSRQILSQTVEDSATRDLRRLLRLDLPELV